MTVRPRPAVLGALALAVLLHVLTRTSGVAWLALGSAGALALPVASLLMRPRLDALEVRLVLPHRVAAGDRVAVEVVATNLGRGPTPACEWSTDHPGLGPLAATLPALEPGATVRLPVTATADHRGVHPAGPVQLATTAPYGLLRWSVTRAGAEPALVVHPATQHRRELPADGATAVADRSVSAAGTGTEVLGLRPWRQGDAVRHLSARASARHGRPVVLERERETGPSLVLLAVGGGAGPAWERAVAHAASLVLAALRDGRPPVLLADPPPTRRDAVGLLDFFAGVDAAGPPRDADVRAALRAAGRGGTLLLLTPAGAGPDSEPLRRAAAAAGVRLEVVGA